MIESLYDDERFYLYRINFDHFETLTNKLYHNPLLGRVGRGKFFMICNVGREKL